MEKDIRLEELEGLRQQLTLLNKKLEKQSIVNEKLIRNSMREKMLNINRTGIVMCAAMLIATPICALEFHYVLHISLALNIFTCGFMAIAFAYTIWSHWGLNSNLLNGDLITASSIILRTRKRYKQWYYFSWPWFAVWFCWLCYEISIKIENTEMLIGVIVGGIIGLIVGGTWGLRQRNKIYRNIDAMLEEIEELKQEHTL